MAPSLRRVVSCCLVLGVVACSSGRPEPELPDAGPGGGGTSTLEPTPEGAMGKPFDPSKDSYFGPSQLIANGVPRIVSVATSPSTVDVAWLDTRSPQIILSRIIADGDGFRIDWQTVTRHNLP